MRSSISNAEPSNIYSQMNLLGTSPIYTFFVFPRLAKDSSSPYTRMGLGAFLLEFDNNYWNTICQAIT